MDTLHVISLAQHANTSLDSKLNVLASKGELGSGCLTCRLRRKVCCDAYLEPTFPYDVL